jgi:putative phosphonate transport system ATP-binding protein
MDDLMNREAPLLLLQGVGHRFDGARDGHWAVREASLQLYPGEVLAIVGEPGAGKSTLLDCIAGRLRPTAGHVLYRDAAGSVLDVHTMPERERRRLAGTEWSFIEQQAHDGLRMAVSAGADVGERSHDVLATRPRLVLMDEPTAGLDASAQAGLHDVIRQLVARLRTSVVFVTHDLGVARLLAHRTLVMQRGRVVEEGLTDRVLDDPRHAHTQLLVASAVPP